MYKTQKKSKVQRLLRLLRLLGIGGLAFLLLTISAIAVNAAASSDRDLPTPLTSNNLKGELDAAAPQLDGGGTESFYSFLAGPGDLTITVDVKSTDGTAVINFELLDHNAAKSLASSYAQANSTGQTGREIRTVKLDTHQMIVLLLKQTSGKGTYTVELTGTAVSDVQPAITTSSQRTDLFLERVSFAGSGSATATPNIEGTYRLISRKLPDGSIHTDGVGLMTFTKNQRNFNIVWKDAKGKFFSYSIVSTYKLTATDYTETILSSVLNDQIGGKEIVYDSGKTQTVPVKFSGGRVEMKLPFDPPTVVFEGKKMTATSEGVFVDSWEKIE